MDSKVGDIAQADVLLEGRKLVAVQPTIQAADAAVIEAAGRIVMPGFIDTHHHQFETALRSFLADGLLFNDGRPHGQVNHFDYILGKFAPVYRPEDVHISELFGSLAQLDAGVTTVLDVPRSIIRRSTATPRSRGSQSPAAAACSGISRGRAIGPDIRVTRAA